MASWLASIPTPKGVWIRFAKKGAAWTGLGKQQALDVALCHGWIDGQAAKFDDESFLMRFTPRRPRSMWSQVNCARVTRLMADGRLQTSGLREVEAAQADGRWEAAYAPPSTIKIPAELANALGNSPHASAAFATLSKSKRYLLLLDITTKKKPETRTRKIRELIVMLVAKFAVSVVP